MGAALVAAAAAAAAAAVEVIAAASTACEEREGLAGDRGDGGEMVGRGMDRACVSQEPGERERERALRRALGCGA